MCGIAGLFDTRGKRDFDRELMLRMNDIQHHRGPDGELRVIGKKHLTHDLLSQ